ncbi:MAG: polysaccharide biosynthesis C-terminal domain-containing protein [Candidatus Hatepunaea meridiana]|nr:polysaccharide biosynthesis C-terminal domain-containing protein [Candidatus Hatepunaea meridiana]
MPRMEGFGYWNVNYNVYGVKFTLSISGKLYGKLIAAFSGQIGVFIFGFAIQIILARTLGPEGKGVFSLVTLIVTVLYMFVHGSLGAADAHFSGRFPKWGPAIFGNNVTIALLTGGAIVLFFLTFSERFMPAIQPNVDLSLTNATVIVLPFLILFEYSISTILGQDRIGRYSLILSTKELLFLVSLFILLLSGFLSVQTALLAWVVVAILIALYAAWSAWSGVGFKFKIDLKVLLPMAKYSLQGHIANLSSFLKMNSDKLIMAYFLDVEEVGYYSVAVAIVSVLYHLPSSVSQVLVPFISWRDNHAGDILTPQLCRITFFLTIIIGLMIGVFGWIGIMLFFSSKFIPAYPALIILLPGAVILSLAKLLAGDLSGRGKPQYAMVISVIVVIINIGANLILIPLWQMKGAAVTASFTHAMTGLMFLWAFKRESGVAYVEALLIKGSDFRQIYQALIKMLKKQ